MGFIILDDFKIEKDAYLAYSLVKNQSLFTKIINFFRRSEEYKANFKFQIDVEKQVIFVSAGAFQEFTERQIRELVYQQLYISHKEAKK